MTTLAVAVDADDELWTLDDLPTPEAPYVEVGSELIEVRSRFPSQTYTLTGETLPPKIRVRRGIAGTTAASHIQGSTLTPNYGLGGGSGAGGVTVDNGDEEAEVALIRAPGADLSTPGEADLSGRLTFRLLGPYTVNFDDSDIGTGIHEVVALDTGLLVVNAWCLPTTAWEHSAGPPDTSSFYITVHVGAAGGGGGPADLTVAYYDNVDSLRPANEPDPGGSGLVYKLTALTDSISTLGFQAYPDVGAFTAGVMDIYLVVAEPVA